MERQKAGGAATACLSGGDMPRWLVGARKPSCCPDSRCGFAEPIGTGDHEPPPEGPGGVPPCPKGVNATRWVYADERERLG